MPLDLKTVGQTTAVHTLAYDWKTLATYALGVGAKKDELAYLYEGTPDGMKVLPTFAVIPAQAAVFESLSATGGDLAMIVHGGQTVRVRGQIAESGTLETTGTMRAIYDLKKFAQVIIDTKTTQADKLVYETTWSIIFRGAGNFGGPRPVSEDTPSVPKDRPADFRIEESTSPEQALLYRLSGDLNPLHADPAGADPPRPVHVRLPGAGGRALRSEGRPVENSRHRGAVPPPGLALRHVRHRGLRSR